MHLSQRPDAGSDMMHFVLHRRQSMHAIDAAGRARFFAAGVDVDTADRGIGGACSA